MNKYFEDAIIGAVILIAAPAVALLAVVLAPFWLVTKIAEKFNWIPWETK